MNEEIKDLWIAALRSDKYTQGKGYLKAGRGTKINHCCLGVLCEISGIVEFKALNDTIDDEQGPSLQVYGVYDGQSYEGDHYQRSYLPDPVMKWAGMLSRDGETPDLDGLDKMNDSGFTFEAIADHIEKNWKNL